ncbi:MAG: FG-GAP-like repeat-containing protein [Kiritimatiellae bacterium]|nr:FG-GAP-like repeat-containing protein [Kiritimatiellia bacterium]
MLNYGSGNHKVMLAVALAAVAGVFAGAEEHDVLLVRGDHYVERFAVSDAGMWKSKGFFLEKPKCGVVPTAVAALGDGSVLIGDAGEGGRILQYSADGVLQGVLAKTGFRPNYFCLSADEKWLYVTDGKGIHCYGVASGKGRALISSGLDGASGFAFGGDGMLYVTCPYEGRVAVIDVDKGELKAKIDAFNVLRAIAFAGKDGSVMVLPSERPEVIDLVCGKTALMKDDATLRDVFASVRIGDRIYAVDYPTGDIYAINLVENRIHRSGTGAIYANGIVDLTAAKAGGVKFSKPKGAFKHETPVPRRNDFARMPCNNPESVVDLKAGFGAGWLDVRDYNKDGTPDIIVGCGWAHWPWRGNYVYLNPAKPGEKNVDPVFPKAKKIPDDEFFPLLKLTGYETFTGADGKPLPPPHYTRTVYEQKGFADYDGDGRDDLIIAAADREWDEWHDKYDARGIWTAGHQVHGYVYVSKCLGGKGVSGKYATAEIVRLEDGSPLEVYGNNPSLLHDWDGDGDLDFVVFDFCGYITYFENIGTRTKPVYTSGRLLHDDTGAILKGHLCLPLAKAHDWDGDGLMDILLAEEDSRVGWFRHTGKVEKGLPVFAPVSYFRQHADELNFGVLATPWAYDWDGDGDEDIICGNSHGQIAFIENLSGPKVEAPKWATPVRLAESGGKVIWMKAGPNGSIQGPCESEWGYAVVCVADWDGDGLPDIMANNIRGEIRWWKNIGTRTRPKLDYAQGVEVAWNGKQPPLKWGWLKPETQPNPKWIVAPWRTTPVMHDWNGDGLADLTVLDGDNNLAFYERAKDASGKLILKAPRKAFLDENGKPLWFPGSWGTVAGGAGRYKFCVCDWDGDGETDMVFNAGRNARLLRFVKSDAKGWYFRYAGPLARLDLSTHDPASSVCDFNGDGVPDMLMGAMDGYIYYLKNSRKGR